MRLDIYVTRKSICFCSFSTFISSYFNYNYIYIIAKIRHPCHDLFAFSTNAEARVCRCTISAGTNANGKNSVASSPPIFNTLSFVFNILNSSDVFEKCLILIPTKEIQRSCHVRFVAKVLEIPAS